MRWLVVAAVLLVATAVALWPRGGGPAPRTPPPGPDVTAARAAAALPPCRVTGSGPEQLRGVTATCLADGAPFDASDLLGGRDVLLNVWATWCGPCREELPLLAEYAQGDDAVEVVTLAVQSNQGDALVLLRDLGVRLPALIDETGEVARALRLPTGLPASYLVRDGKVELIGDPRLFRTLDEIRTAVRR